VSAEAGDVNPLTCPSYAHVTLAFPARGKMVPVTLHWYEGKKDGKKLLPPDDLATLYRAADVTVVPSHNESFGLVAVESQACGTPVVAAAVGGLVTAVSDGRSGILVDGHDPARYAQVLSGLVAEPRRRQALAAGAAEHAAGFSWQRTADGLLAVYRDALRRHQDEEVVEAVS